MKRQLLLTCLYAACGLSVLAAPAEAEWICINEVVAEAADGSMVKVKVLDRVEAADASEPVKFDAVVTSPGTLAEVIGDRLNEIDEIEVRGLINEADFATLWQASFEGKLKVVNLSKAFVVGDVVPAGAFYHHDAQMDPQTHRVKTIALEKLYLPQGVTEIGPDMAMYCSNLVDVKLNAPLKKIGAAAFFSCTSLAADNLILPEGLEVVERTAFSNNSSLSGQLVFPTSLKSIGSNAFASTGFTGVTFNGPVNIGSQAFMGSKLAEVDLPEGCTFAELPGQQFAMCYALTKAKLPADAKVVPFGMFNTCVALESVELPAGLEEIKEEAFSNTSIASIQFPEGTTTIGADAFRGCVNLETLSLPLSLSEIDEYAFGLCTGLKDIYSKIANPSATKAFSGVDYDKAIVYIPEGTKELYERTPGWSDFKNLVEVSAMGGMDEIGVEASSVGGKVYDLYGRRVQRLNPGQVYIREGKKFIGK